MYLLMVFKVSPTLQISLQEVITQIRPTKNNPKNFWARFSTKDERITKVLNDLKLKFAWYEVEGQPWLPSKDKGLIDFASRVPNGFRTKRQADMGITNRKYNRKRH